MGRVSVYPEMVLANARYDYMLWRSYKGDTIPISEGWQANYNRMAAIIPSFQTAIEAIQWAQNHTHTGFDHRSTFSFSIDIANEQIALLERMYPHMDKRLFREHPLSTNTGQWQDCWTSNILLGWHVAQYLRCMNSFEHRGQPIVELGSGYGALARLFGAMDCGRDYYLVDQPESLFFAECYLYSDEVKGNFHFIPMGIARQQLQGVVIDLVINTGSFQEMPRGAVEYWATTMNHHWTVNQIYSLNYEETPIMECLGPGWRARECTKKPMPQCLQAANHFQEMVLVRG